MEGLCHLPRIIAGLACFRIVFSTSYQKSRYIYIHVYICTYMYMYIHIRYMHIQSICVYKKVKLVGHLYLCTHCPQVRGTLM